MLWNENRTVSNSKRACSPSHMKSSKLVQIFFDTLKQTPGSNVTSIIYQMPLLFWIKTLVCSRRSGWLATNDSSEKAVEWKRESSNGWLKFFHQLFYPTDRAKRLGETIKQAKQLIILQSCSGVIYIEHLKCIFKSIPSCSSFYNLLYIVSNLWSEPRLLSPSFLSIHFHIGSCHFLSTNTSYC